ncbi:hypothetical protein VPHK375_0056 [Vibrio phage K375]
MHPINNPTIFIFSYLQPSKFTHTITCAIMVNSDEAHNF